MASEQEKFLDRLRKLERQLDKLTTDFFYCEAFLDTPRGSFWQPPTDVYETDSDVVVRIEAPGLDVTDILIVIRSNALLVRGVRRDTAPGPKRTCRQLEIRYGLFERVVALPPNVRHDQAAATYTNGFLVVTVPKCEEPHELADAVQLRL